MGAGQSDNAAGWRREAGGEWMIEYSTPAGARVRERKTQKGP